MAFILIAEDEKNIGDVVKEILEAESHTVKVVRNGAAALAAYNDKSPDLIILDVMMPKKNGFDVCAEIRAEDSTVPILFLTARNEESDKVLGLNTGADDYLTKPFGSQELVARVSALLRRASHSSPNRLNENLFRVAGHEVDMNRLKLKKIATGRVMNITPQDANILKLFADNPGVVLSRDAFIDKVWGMRMGATTRMVDMAILKVRKILGAESRSIETVRSAGYRLCED